MVVYTVVIQLFFEIYQRVDLWNVFCFVYRLRKNRRDGNEKDVCRAGNESDFGEFE